MLTRIQGYSVRLVYQREFLQSQVEMTAVKRKWDSLIDRRPEEVKAPRESLLNTCTTLHFLKVFRESGSLAPHCCLYVEERKKKSLFFFNSCSTSLLLRTWKWEWTSWMNGNEENILSVPAKKVLVMKRWSDISAKFLVPGAFLVT